MGGLVVGGTASGMKNGAAIEILHVHIMRDQHKNFRSKNKCVYK